MFVKENAITYYQKECATLEKILKERFSGKLLDTSFISPIENLWAKKISNFSPADSIWRQYSLDYPQFLNQISCDWIYSLIADTYLLPYILGFFSLRIFVRSECFSKARSKWIRH